MENKWKSKEQRSLGFVMAMTVVPGAKDRQSPRAQHQASSTDLSGLQLRARSGMGPWSLSSWLLLWISRATGGITSVLLKRRQQSINYSEEHILEFFGGSVFPRACWGVTRKILVPDCHCDYFFSLRLVCSGKRIFHLSNNGRKGTKKTSPNNRNEQESVKWYSAWANIMVDIL